MMITSCIDLNCFDFVFLLLPTVSTCEFLLLSLQIHSNCSFLTCYVCLQSLGEKWCSLQVLQLCK